jgi:hypothetical protein
MNKSTVFRIALTAAAAVCVAPNVSSQPSAGTVKNVNCESVLGRQAAPELCAQRDRDARRGASSGSQINGSQVGRGVPTAPQFTKTGAIRESKTNDSKSANIRTP